MYTVCLGLRLFGAVVHALTEYSGRAALARADTSFARAAVRGCSAC